MCNDCVYCEIIELPSCSKLYIHYNSLFMPLFIEYVDEATNIEISFYKCVLIHKNKVLLNEN